MVAKRPLWLLKKKHLTRPIYVGASCRRRRRRFWLLFKIYCILKGFSGPIHSRWLSPFVFLLVFSIYKNGRKWICVVYYNIGEKKNTCRYNDIVCCAYVLFHLSAYFVVFLPSPETIDTVIKTVSVYRRFSFTPRVHIIHPRVTPRDILWPRP